MKITIAAFRNVEYGGLSFVSIDEDGTCFADRSADYARITENAEVEIPDLPREKVIAARLDSLDAHEQKVRADFSIAIDGIKDQRAKLLSLAAPIDGGE